MRSSFFLAAVVLAVSSSLSFACLRAAPDRRAVQWSDAIVHARLKAIAKPDENHRPVYEFTVVDVVEGSPVPRQTVTVIHITPGGATEACNGDLTAEDAGKTYLLLLRRQPGGERFMIVSIAPVDPGDPVGAATFKQLVDETRKSEAAATPELVKAQAMALANAEDDTESEQAEDALRQMGPKATASIREVAATASAMGKSRLNKLIDELNPPVDTTPPTTQTAEPK